MIGPSEVRCRVGLSSDPKDCPDGCLGGFVVMLAY